MIEDGLMPTRDAFIRAVVTRYPNMNTLRHADLIPASMTSSDWHFGRHLTNPLQKQELFAMPLQLFKNAVRGTPA